MPPKLLHIALSAVSGILLIALLLVVILFNTLIPLPNIEYRGGYSSVSVSEVSEESVCFSTPKIDTGLTNDEEFGPVKSASQSSSLVANLGEVKNTYFDGLTPATESGDIHTNDYELNDIGTKLVTATSSEEAPQVLSADFDNTDESAYSIAGSKEVFTPDGDLRGLAVSKCVKPERDFWFIGGDTHVQNTTSLYLANTGETAAQVMITVWGNDNSAGLSDDGSFKYQASRYIGVDAHSETSVLLSSGAPNQDVLGVHISSQETPVAASIFAHSMQGLSPAGVSYVNPLPSFDRKSVIPGVHIHKEGGKIVTKLNLLAPDTRFDEPIKVKFHISNPENEANLRSVEKEYTLKKSEVNSIALDFLDDGVYTVEVMPDDDMMILSTVQQVLSSENGSELAFANPAPLADTILLNIGNRQDVVVNAYVQSNKPAFYGVTGYSSKGEFLYYKEVTFNPDVTNVFRRDFLQGASILQFVPHSESQESLISANAFWASDDTLEYIGSEPIDTESQVFTFHSEDNLR
jgi:hypothetical protein